MPTPEEIAAAEAAKNKNNTPDPAKELADLKAANADLAKKLAELTKTPDPNNDPSLLDKARKEKEDRDKKSGDSKALESALLFNLKSEEFLKTNESLLPKDIHDVFKLAQKENYSNAIEKDGAIKSGIIQSFFSVQANMDLLTPGLKTSLDDYLKLTKNGKQEKAQAVYDSIFEPAFEMLKRIKKAEALSHGHATSDDDFNVNYKNKLMKLSREVHLGEKAK